MRLTKTIWIILGVAVFIAAAVTLYMFYQGQMRQQDELNVDLSAVNTELARLNLEKGALEDRIEQLESDIVQQEGETTQLQAEISQLEDELSQLEDERAQAEAQAMALLNGIAAEFITSMESIEYDEVLFGFAHDNNIMIQQISISGMSTEVIDDIEYNLLTIDISFRGGVDDTLDFVDTIVADDAFKSSVIRNFGMSMPEPLNDEQLAALEDSITAGLYAQEISKITTDDMIDFILEALADLTGPESDWPEVIKRTAVEGMAQEIAEGIDALVEEEFVDPMAETLTQLILEHIEGSIVGTVIGPLAEQIAASITSGDPDLEGLLGPEIAELLGSSIAGSVGGDVSGLLNEYFSMLLNEKLHDAVASEVIMAAPDAIEQAITNIEMPSSGMTLGIYTYEGE